MSVRKTLSALAQAIAAEADRNPDFRARLEHVLSLSRPSVGRPSSGLAESKRKGGRRTPAVLDPVELARQGEDRLRARLVSLDLERLRDIVAQFGMDPGKLVMKWKDSNRVIDRIVEVSLARATKGDAFRSD
jgi:hypothetical protein